MTDPFTGYFQPYYTYTRLVPLLVIYILLHIYMTSLFTGYLHPYYTYYMTDLFTGYLHPYYTYTWLIPLLVIYIPITHIHHWSLYWLFTSLLRI